MNTNDGEEPTVTNGEGADPAPRWTRASRLGSLAFFAELRLRHLQEIERSMIERKFEAGAYLMRQGEEGDCLLVVQEGQVEVRVTTDGMAHVLNRLGPGNVFGEMALLTREPRTADVVALTPVRALVLPVEEFHHLLQQYPELAEVLSRLTAQRLGKQPVDALSGKAFHGYTIRSRLGQGGMSVVYEAKEQTSGRRVALKMLSHRLVFRESFRRQFQLEADLIEAFEHPNIARMYGRFEAFRTYFIVMEYCDGSPLHRVLSQHGRLAVGHVRRIIGQVAAALTYAHRRRIVHRDIKPSNVMVNRDGVVKLMDFGVAQTLDSNGSCSVLAGTLPYMAPEQLTGGPIGTAADHYALAGLAWNLLTGETLFHGRSPLQLEEQHRIWEVPDIAAALPGVGGEMQQFLAAGLQRDPDRRCVDLRAIAEWSERVPYEAIVAR